MGTLSEASENLSTCLARAESDLHHLLREAEEEFHQRFAKAQANPFAVLQRLKKLERDVPTVQSEYFALLERKKEVVNKIQNAMLCNRDVLCQLEARAGLGASSGAEDFDAFKAVLQECKENV